MAFELIDLASRAKNPEYYDKSHDIAVALAWNAIKKTLQNVGRDELFGYIKSIKITERNIIITTEKPIANAEIKIYQESILDRINTGFTRIKIPKREKILFH